MKLGVIADDFTGAVDIAGFLVQNGMKTVLLNGVAPLTKEAIRNNDAFVISQKIRTCPILEARDKANESIRYLSSIGCERFYFKYCSTFDSTREGNIGPILDEILKTLKEDTTIVCPSLPVNGRTVYQGYLFVKNELLSESPMKNHPLTPMKDSKLIRLLQTQTEHNCLEIPLQTVRKGAGAIEQALSGEKGCYIIDAIEDADLIEIAKGTRNLKVLSGGSGLAIGLGMLYGRGKPCNEEARPAKRKGIVISGSCSKMTNQQVDFYKTKAPSLKLDLEKCIHSTASYVEEVLSWYSSLPEDLHPMVYSTKPAEELKATDRLYEGIKVSEKIETFFGMLTSRLAENGVLNFIIGGGETSGTVVQALATDSYLVGPEIAPGVSWVKSIDKDYSMALKSGNFGTADFYLKAQEDFLWNTSMKGKKSSAYAEICTIWDMQAVRQAICLSAFRMETIS